jgi:glycine/serine hydroxymethyltransferase
MQLQRILEQHRAYRARVLNLIASENTMSPTVERYFMPELSHRYGDYLGTDAGAR